MISTAQSQRTFDNSWAIGDISGMPSGVILDMSFSLPSYREVYLTGFSVSAGSITVYFRSFEDGSSDSSDSSADNLVASVTTSVVGVPVGFTNTADGVFGTILFGRIPQEDTYKVFENPIQVNPELVSVFETVSVEPGTLSIYMNGELSMRLDAMSSNVTILGGDDISVDNSGYVSRMTDTAVGGVSVSLEAGSEQKIYKINNCTPNSEGVISLDITDGNGVIPCTVEGHYALLPAELDNTVTGSVDILDSYLAPKSGRQYPYYPADDAYAVAEGAEYVLGSVRRTVENLGGDEVTYVLDSVTSSGFAGHLAPIDTVGELFDVDMSDSSESASL